MIRHFLVFRREMPPVVYWNAFFGREMTPDISKKRIRETITTTKAFDFFVYDCQFFELNNGCIHLKNQDNVRFLHNHCMFSNQKPSSSAPCIYCEGNMDVVQHRFCAFNITAEVDHSFCISAVKQNSRNFNFVFESYISKSGSINHDSPLYLKYGLIRFAVTNSSTNQAADSAGYCFEASTSTELAVLNFSSFQFNKAESIIVSHLKSGRYKIYRSNFLNNKVYQESGYVFSNAEYTEVCECSFFDNEGKSIFWREAGEFNVNLCLADNYSYNGEFTTSHNLGMGYSWFQFHHRTYGCSALFSLPGDEFKPALQFQGNYIGCEGIGYLDFTLETMFVYSFSFF